MTEYHVLGYDEEADSYRILAEAVPARSARGAIHAAASQKDDWGTAKPLVMVAVPVRHWAPMRVKMSVQTKLEIS